MSALSKYKKTTEREVTAPSGIVYKVRGLSSVEYGNALSGVPGLLPSSGEKSEATLESVLAMQRSVCDQGTLSATYEDETDEGAALPPAEEWPAADIAAVFMAIQAASGLAGQEADAARRAL